MNFEVGLRLDNSSLLYYTGGMFKLSNYVNPEAPLAQYGDRIVYEVPPRSAYDEKHGDEAIYVWQNHVLKLLRTYLSEAQNHRCCWCGVEFDDAVKKTSTTLEHVIPKSQGGHDSWKNLAVACYSCNNHRASETFNEGTYESLREKLINIRDNNPHDERVKKFVRKAVLVHGDAFDYSKTKINLAGSRAKHIYCKTHGHMFSTSTRGHIGYVRENGKIKHPVGCKQCSRERTPETEETHHG